MAIDRELNETLLIKAEDLTKRDVQEYDLIKENSNKYPLKYPNDIIKETRKSVFRMVYNQAFEQISLILNNSLDIKRHDIENIIAFTGRRGTGKTSAMYSIEKYLCTNEIEFANIVDKRNTFRFIELYNMKASDLKDDIFEHVIDAIRYKLDEFINDKMFLHSESDFIKGKELQEAACVMKKDYCSFKNNNVLSDYSYNSIMRISNKPDISERFCKLIKDYSALLSEENNVFFTICIDDLDMASDNSKELIQDIHKYLMIPNLIVFVTTDFSLLNSEIQKSFYENLCPIKDIEAMEDMSMKQVHALLKKIIPSDNRITMPSWKKKDYIDMFPVKICFDGNVKENFSKIFPRLIDSEFQKFINNKKAVNQVYHITPKDFILMLIANRTKIYLDAKGYKYHFMEPDSLRNMYDMFYLLYNMNNLIPEYDEYSKMKKTYKAVKKKYEEELRESEKEYISALNDAGDDENRRKMIKKREVAKDEIIDEYENKIADYYYHRSENRKRLLDYIHFTMRDDMRFSSEESDFIDKLLAQPVERRGKMIWDRYFSVLMTEEIANKIKRTYGGEFYNAESEKSKIENYSFGELFRIIFTSTRLGVFDKKFVRFIIAIFSFSLPAFVERAKKEEKDYKESAEKHEPYKRLEDNFGYSFLGTWRDDLFIKNNHKPCLKIDFNLLKGAINKEGNISNVISALLYLFMLTSKKDDIRVCYVGEVIEIYSDPDPTAFLMNIINIRKRLEDKIITFSEKGVKRTISMLEMLKEILVKAGYSGEDMEEALEMKPSNGENEKNYLCKAVNDLEDNYRECHLSNMLKHMDLVYNVIKRVVSKTLYKDSNNISKKEQTWLCDDIGKFYKEFYDGIVKKLEENDKIYFSSDSKPNEEGNSLYFSSRFKNSKIVCFFNNYDNDEEKNQNNPRCKFKLTYKKCKDELGISIKNIED